MLNVVVILLTLFTCIDGEANMANALLPLARTDVLDSSSNSSMMVDRLIADPKLFVSQMASADPEGIRTVVGMLQLLIQTGTTAINKFERDVTVAKDDKDAKIMIHDDLSSLVENLTKTEEDLVAETGVVTATLVTKTEEKRVADLDRTAAVTHHTSMVAERDANVPDLTSENIALSSAVSILEGLLETMIFSEARPALLGDSCGGWRESTCGGVFYAAMVSNIWNTTFNYGCPDGFRWITSDQFTENIAQSSTCQDVKTRMSKTYYSLCGWQRSWFGGVKRHYFRFSDSTLKNGYSVGNDSKDNVGVRVNKGAINFAGIVCSAE